MKKISIIIPHYNSPGMLETLLKSIVEEAPAGGIDVIVTDDNSTKEVDLYNDVKARFSAAYPGAITFLRNTTGKNASGTCRNFGLEAATGDWILFADADDYMAPGWYGIVAEYLDSDYDMIRFSAISHNVTTDEPAQRHLDVKTLVERYDPAKEETVLAMRYRSGSPWARLIRRSVIEEHALRFPPYLWGDDLLFTTQVGYYATRIHADVRPIYCVTESEVCVTNQVTMTAWQARIKTAMAFDQFLTEKYDDPAIVTKYGIFPNKMLSLIGQNGYAGLWQGLRLSGCYMRKCFARYGVKKVLSTAKLPGMLAKAKAAGRRIYIYGAGVYGREHFYRITSLGVMPTAFVVTKASDNIDAMFGLPIVGMDALDYDKKEDLFLIAIRVGGEAIAQELREKGIKHVMALPC